MMAGRPKTVCMLLASLLCGRIEGRIGLADDEELGAAFTSFKDDIGASLFKGDIGRRLQSDDFVFETCQEATEVFRGSYDRFYNGTNWLKNFYNCTCQGDLTATFSMRCSRSNFCFTSVTPLAGVAVNVCLKQVEFNFDIEISENQDGTRDADMSYFSSCFEYDKGGPVSGKLCNRFNYKCVTLLKEEHGRYTEDAAMACSSLDECRHYLQAVGYSRETATDLCPIKTLNGKLCKTYVGDFGKNDICADAFGSDFSLTPDCSNVEPCAVASCRSLAVREDRSIPVYPQCGADGIELSDTETPPSPALLLKCQANGQNTMNEFDECIYKSGFLSDQNIRECRECLATTIIAKRTYESSRNCTEFASAVCDVFLSNCTQICGPCSLPGYNMLSCIIDENPGLLKCELNCPPPENVGEGWDPIYRDTAESLASAGGETESWFRAITFSVLFALAVFRF